MNLGFSSFAAWVRRLFQSKPRTIRNAARRERDKNRFVPRVEVLEDRTAPALLSGGTLADDLEENSLDSSLEELVAQDQAMRFNDHAGELAAASQTAGSSSAGGSPAPTANGSSSAHPVQSNTPPGTDAEHDALFHAVSTAAGSAESPAAAVVSSDAGQTFQWVLRAGFTDPRTNSGIEGAAASLIDGKIYVSHGYRLGDSNLLSVYDTASDTWTHGGRSAPDAFVFRSELAGGTALGKHYAIGGRVTSVSNAIEVFDPMTVSWSTAGHLQTARAGMGAAS